MKQMLLHQLVYRIEGVDHTALISQGVLELPAATNAYGNNEAAFISVAGLFANVEARRPQITDVIAQTPCGSAE